MIRRRPIMAMLRRAGLALWIALALAVTADFVARAMLAHSGHQLMVVTGGSMAPTLRAGDAVVVTPADASTLRPGTVVVFRAPVSAALTAHRVLSVHDIDGEPYLRTQGDHNPSPDPDLVPVRAVGGAVVQRVPLLGRMLLWYGQRATRFFVVGVLAVPVAFAASRDVLASPFAARARALVPERLPGGRRRPR